MNLILTMAGQYQRFVREGYKIPKYLLPWGDRSILSTVLLELNREQAFDNIYLIANHRDEAYFPHVRSIMQAQGIPNSNLVAIHDTKGQAETAKMGVDKVSELTDSVNSPIIFHNIDTILRNRDLKAVEGILKVNAGYIDVFYANNHEYSYVLSEVSGMITDIAEKIVVSNLATSGFYGFNSINTFLKYYKPEDLYISSIYKKMIEGRESIIASREHKEVDTIVLGTPFEYMNAASTYLL
ncbi:hypothetical protein [Polynucleobacter sp. 80A-SIGWE]|uniref:hypothetical protein n=1 Tax=Polynucleobacter sp. 80A-SIGWE TaxID=2689100 RepID=UPI001C0AB78F|nr:hypothetical protein [Polynucleobacter sp. 80A-SIGWE]